MLTYVNVADAQRMPGLRIALSHGVPGPWSMAARAIFELKGIPFVAVPHEAGAPNEALHEWTRQNGAPAAMLDDERPRTHWSELLLLAERLAPTPALIPAEQDERAAMFGLCHEICGEDGFGWNARLLIFLILDAGANPALAAMLPKYTSGESLDHARARVAAIIAMLARRLDAQAGRGSGFLVGNALTAADICWAAFSNLVQPIAPETCVMPDYYRTATAANGALLGEVPPVLIAHRERILQDSFKLPIEF